jgi:transcriptional regulator of acetoin/glycerol metabolism
VSIEPAIMPVPRLYGQAAWMRTLEVRERYLAAGDPDQLPPPDCGVRREIIVSWRRSLLSGVDTASTDLPCDGDAVPPGRLIRAARPVLERLADEIAGTQVWAFLADRECRLVSHVVGDRSLTPLLEERGAFPGARFGEDVVGTNGLGTAVEQQRPFIVVGSEHYRAHESEACTVGVPVRDPLTGRLAGLLNMNCHYQLTSPLMLPFVTRLAGEIEDRLLDACHASGQELLHEVARMWKRRSRAVLVLSDEVLVANAAAITLLGGTAEHELLREWALQACAGAQASGRERTMKLELGPDLVITARCRPLPVGSRHPAAVVTLTRPAAPARASSPAQCPSTVQCPSTAQRPSTVRRPSTAQRPSSAERAGGQLSRARAAGLPVLLCGERGTGKTTLARTCHDLATAPGQLTIVDCALSGAHPRGWAQRLGAAIEAAGDGPSNTVILRHLDTLNPALAASVTDLLASAHAWVVATAPSAGLVDATVAESFGAIVDIPPLRDRAADIPALVAGILAQLRPEAPRPRCTPEALTALAAGDWPGNVRQLRQVVATALIRSMSCDITIGDLPGRYPGNARGKHLTGLERAARDALLEALRDADWDREAAARALGISRATIYRKLKRLDITPPAARPAPP